MCLIGPELEQCHPLNRNQPTAATKQALCGFQQEMEDHTATNVADDSYLLGGPQDVFAVARPQSSRSFVLSQANTFQGDRASVTRRV